MNTSEKLEIALTRAVEEVIDITNLNKKLKTKTKLRIKFGVDPTSPYIHLGRTIPLLKLKDFQDMGHQIIIVIGTFTAQIGDTSDKDSERPMLKKEEVEKNLLKYEEQIAKILDIEKTEIVYNNEWLSKLTYIDVSRQATNFSVNEFCSREVIRRRMLKGSRVSLRELLYPLMQGYDSVQVRADVEVGGVDQRFNLLTGRDIQKLYGQKPQDIITCKLVNGLDGKKMSSSQNNTIKILERPNDMYGKIMSLKDELIIEYFKLLTRVDLDVISKYEKEIKGGKNPKDYKEILAFTIVNMYHSTTLADSAKKHFQNVFSNKQIPADIKEFKPANYNIISILVELKFESSKSQAKRDVEQGGVRIDNEKVIDSNFIVKQNSILRKGKMNFIKII